MKRFIDWLSEKFAPKKPAADLMLRQTGARKIRKHTMKNPIVKEPPRLDPVVQRDARYETRLSGKIVDGGPGKNVLIRNKYIREDSGTHETLKIVDDSLLDSDDDFGLDPYNTGRFDRSKSWDNSRK